MRTIDDLMGKCRNRIQAIGIELEGGWAKLPKGVALEHDGSVQINVQGVHQGEIPSPPLRVRADPGKPPEWKTWLHAHYPSHVNATCGMHVHVSFRSQLLYSRLMTPDLTSETVRLMTAWAEARKLSKDHPLWARLRGESEYCQPRFDAEKQTKPTRKGHDRRAPGNRYTMWNYCYGIHSTAECRLLPMMQDSNLAVDAIQHLLDIVNAFLVSRATREKPSEAIIVADEYSLVQEVSLCV